MRFDCDEFIAEVRLSSLGKWVFDEAREHERFLRDKIKEAYATAAKRHGDIRGHASLVASYLNNLLPLGRQHRWVLVLNSSTNLSLSYLVNVRSYTSRGLEPISHPVLFIIGIPA